jgi:hypothetical protein
MLTGITNFGTASFLSLVIAAAYFVLSLLVVVGSHRSFKEVLVVVSVAAGHLVMPLLCIWFGDEMGGYIGALPGPRSINGHYILIYAKRDCIGCSAGSRLNYLACIAS